MAEVTAPMCFVTAIVICHCDLCVHTFVDSSAEHILRRRPVVLVGSGDHSQVIHTFGVHPTRWPLSSDVVNSCLVKCTLHQLEGPCFGQVYQNVGITILPWGFLKKNSRGTARGS